jgi:hypothetical protein
MVPSVLDGVGAIGDSYTVERGGNNWTAQLAVGRGFNFGPSHPVSGAVVPWDTHDYVLTGYPREMSGGAVSPAVAALAAQVAAGNVTLIYLDGVGNDFGQVYPALYQGTLTGSALSTFIDNEVADVQAELDTLSAAGNVKFILENVGDVGTLPAFVQNVGNVLNLQPGETPDPLRQRIATDAIRETNARLQDLADARGIPVVDQFGWAQRLFDTSQPPVVGGLTIDNSPTFPALSTNIVTDPLHLFIDSQHVGPVAQGLKANVVLDAIRQAYGVDIAPFTDQEILTYAYRQAGLTPPTFSDTTYYDVSGLVHYNHPPTAADYTATTREGTPVTVAVLANDSDPDGDPLTVTAVSPPAHGTVVVNPDQTVTYLPDAGFRGATDTFTYTVSDGRHRTATGTVSIAVTRAVAFDSLSGPTITFGSASDSLSGHIAAEGVVPPGAVAITLDGVTQQAAIDPATGSFAAVFSTAALPVAGSPYAILYSYAGDAEFSAGVDGTKTLTVNKADQAIPPNWPARALGANSVTLNLTSTSGLPVSYRVTGPATFNPDTDVLTVTGVGTVTVTASQPGNGNYNPAADVATSYTVTPASLCGVLFKDFNEDGFQDFGELGAAGVQVQLSGTDFNGVPVSLPATTGASGYYQFPNLLPGTYAVTVPGSLTVTKVTVGLNGSDAVVVGGGNSAAGLAIAEGTVQNVVSFGLEPPAGDALHRGQTAGIGFWNNRNGQALVKSLNGGAGTQLGDWLASTLPNMFGAAGHDLAGSTNAQVAGYFQVLFATKGDKLEAQVLATALSVYVTNSTLAGGGYAAPYGFTVVAGGGTGLATVTVGADGAAVDQANGATLTILDILLAVDRHATQKATAAGFLLYAGDPTTRGLADDLFGRINDLGGI